MVRKRAFDAFRFAQPKDIAKALEPFRSHQWHLLVMLAHDPASLDLAKSSPALAYLLAQRLGADSELIRSLNARTMSQRDLLACLDLPDSAAMVKLMRKVRPESIVTYNCAVAGLSAAARRICGNLFAHLPVINTGVIETAPVPGCLKPRPPACLRRSAPCGRNITGPGGSDVRTLSTCRSNCAAAIRCGFSPTWNGSVRI
ncbi:MAG: hypothetical protein R3F31_14170 [Verrucomicrobiales bacterium]